MKIRDKNKHYTFMVVPHDAAGRTISVRIPAFVVRYLLLFAVVSISVFSISLLYSTFISGKLVHYGLVVAREAENNKKVESILSETSSLQQELQSVLDQNNELRKVLGLRINKTKVVIGDKSKGNKQPLGLNLKLNKVSSVLGISLREAKENTISVEELKARVKDIQSRLASTPSSWPLFGRVVSGYGYRRSPWRGLHTGIDLKASYGAPVRSTAPGIVSYAGWRAGYGRTVEIDHGYGFKTLYGHNSKILVTPGERVSKGQMVARVGMTGWTTGPHLHYEVRKHDVPINPVAFLNLSILSAGRYF